MRLPCMLRQQTQTVYTTFPTAFRSGDFSQALPGHVVTDPLTGNPFPNNVIPIARLDPLAIKLLQYYPAPNIPGADLSNNYLALDNITADKYQFTQRVDFAQSATSSWSGRYSMQHERGIRPALADNGMSLATDATQAMINNTSILSPSLVNEFRFGYLGFFNNFAPELANKTDVVKQLGLPGLLSDPAPEAWGIPQVNLSDGFSGFGNNADGPYATRDSIFQWVDDLSWTHGRHSFKFGADIDLTLWSGHLHRPRWADGFKSDPVGSHEFRPTLGNCVESHCQLDGPRRRRHFLLTGHWQSRF